MYVQGDSFPIPEEWRMPQKKTVDGKDTFKLYTYKSGLEEDTYKIPSDKTDVVIYVTVEDNGELYYYEDFEGDASGYTYRTGANKCVTGINDEESNNYWYFYGTDKAGRNGYVTLSNVPKITGKYKFEVDVLLSRSGEGSASQFAIFTGSSNPADNTWVSSNYLLPIAAQAGSSGDAKNKQTWYIGGTDSSTFTSLSNTVSLSSYGYNNNPAAGGFTAPTEWNHIEITVDTSSDTADLKITDATGSVVYDSTGSNEKLTINGDRIVKGLAYTGNHYGGILIDNIKISAVE